jgi:hypothetical protein
VGVYLLCSIVFHYFSCMLKGPGRVPKLQDISQEAQQHMADYDPERRENQTRRFCKPCNNVKVAPDNALLHVTAPDNTVSSHDPSLCRVRL